MAKQGAQVVVFKATLRFFVILYSNRYVLRILRGCRGSDHMVIATTCAISAYHHSCCEFEF
jgi:hypothetical protein